MPMRMRSIVATLAMSACLALPGCAATADRAEPAGSAVSHRHDHASSPFEHTHDGGDEHSRLHAHSHDHADDALVALASQHPAHDPQAPCICSLKQTHNVWCRHCNVGYLAMRRIDSAMLFDALDPHGHDIDQSTLQCTVCLAAVRTDGYCHDCRMGFVEGRAYFTPLTHGLAQGRPVAPEDIECPQCQRNIQSTGWCDRCGRGMVGNVAFADRALFERTAEQWRVLDDAQARVETCELCACAMVVHSACPKCRISYAQEGQATTNHP